MLCHTCLRDAAILGLCVLTVACGLPEDPDETSERIASTHELRVGVSDAPPWTDASHTQPTGTEPNLVRRFAASIGARVVWRKGSETMLVQSLKEHEVDVFIGGF